MTPYVRQIEYALPGRRVTNDALKAAHPDWNFDQIAPKTGVDVRYFAEEGQLASDLAHEVVSKVLETADVSADGIEAIIYCTQSPDYIVPPNSTLLQARLGLPNHVAAFDITLGCSGYVYGLAIASSMMSSLGFRNSLLVTADTYSRRINPRDRSTMTVLGDAAAVSLLSDSGDPATRMIDFSFGTDGTGADAFMIPAGGLRHPRSSNTCIPKRDLSGNERSDEDVSMDGPAVLKFALREVPPAVRDILSRNGLTVNDLDLILFHQASRLALDRLNEALAIPPEKTFSNIRNVGNTSSSSIPIAARDAERAGALKRGDLVLLVGFGVGLSWACSLMRW